MDKRKKTLITEAQAVQIIVSVVTGIASFAGAPALAIYAGQIANGLIAVFTWWSRSKMKKDAVVVAAVVRSADEVKARLGEEIDALKGEIDKPQ